MYDLKMELEQESKFNNDRIIGISKLALKCLHWAAGRGDRHVTLNYDRKETFADDLVALKRESLKVKVSGKGDFKSITVFW